MLRAARGPKASITGFNMRAFKEAAGQPRYDPWERALVPPLRERFGESETRTRAGSPAQEGRGAGKLRGFRLTVHLSGRDAWRFAGPFTRWNRFKGTLPGLGTATVAFAGYCLYEHFFMQDEHHHDEEHH